MKTDDRMRTCQNMKGLLGGANAFHFLTFVVGLVTLVVNVENNLNQNNNNLNGINVNANRQTNNNANANNNAMNMIEVMPGRRKRRRRSEIIQRMKFYNDSFGD